MGRACKTYRPRPICSAQGTKNPLPLGMGSVKPHYKKGQVELICKEDGIVAGLQVFQRVFQLLDPKTEVVFDVQDGEAVQKGQHMATVVGTKTTLLDTRKTTPCMRIFEKYAVTVGGGSNHRYNLSDGVLLKDNHIDAAGSVKAAVLAAKDYAPFVRKIEVETESLEQVQEALEAGADIIMLDNMTPDMMAEAVKLIDGRAKTECSGNITKENIEKITAIGVDYVSSGALTHSAPILDISLKHLKALEE